MMEEQLEVLLRSQMSTEELVQALVGLIRNSPELRRAILEDVSEGADADVTNRVSRRVVGRFVVLCGRSVWICLALLVRWISMPWRAGMVLVGRWLSEHLQKAAFITAALTRHCSL
jgi:hypothetical protein